jgi:hypothetical protein
MSNMQFPFPISAFLRSSWRKNKSALSANERKQLHWKTRSIRITVCVCANQKKKKKPSYRRIDFKIGPVHKLSE